MMNEKEEWIKNNVDVKGYGIDISITCGHGRDDYVLTLRQQNPRVGYVCCPGCYYMLVGRILDDVFTIKQR